MKKYESPEFKLIKLCIEDVITTSGDEPTVPPPTTGGGDPNATPWA